MDDWFKLFFWELKFVLVEMNTLEMQRVSIFVVKDWIRIQCQCLICDLSQVNVMLLRTSSEQFFSYIQDDDFETVSDSVVFLFFIFFHETWFLCDWKRHGFEPRSGQSKDYKIGICCFSAKRAALRSNRKDCLARIQNNEFNLYSDSSLKQVCG
jgi:hypothetical protein